jgi:hypothetical protein
MFFQADGTPGTVESVDVIAQTREMWDLTVDAGSVSGNAGVILEPPTC